MNPAICAAGEVVLAPCAPKGNPALAERAVHSERVVAAGVAPDEASVSIYLRSLLSDYRPLFLGGGGNPFASRSLIRPGVPLRNL